MIGHYLKVVWNRKKANSLVLAEILTSFIVLCIVFTVVAHYATNWRRPLGYDYRNAWSISVYIPELANGGDDEAEARGLALSKQVLGAMKSHPEVVAAAPMPNVPYSGGTWSMGINLADRRLVQFLHSPTTPEGKDVLKVDLIAGRWIEPGDEALDFTPVVLTEKLGRRIFGRENPLGRTIEGFKEDGSPNPPENSWNVMRVVGIVRDYRKTGELSESPYASFLPQAMDDPKRGHAPWSYMLRVNPGTSAVFEERLLASLRAVAPDWSFTARPLELERQQYLKSRFLPLLIGGALAGFLILMVGMGLLGVLWQNVTRRTQELGLRRALGATADEVRRQIIGEIVMLATLAVIPGAILFLQVPLLEVVSFVEFGVFVIAAVMAVAVIVPFVILCGLYPGWLATRVDPSQALQYE